MIKDIQAQFAEGQPITSSAPSQYTYEQQAKGDAYEDALWLVVRVATSFGSPTNAAQLQVLVQTSDTVDDENDLNGTVITLDESPVFTVPELVAGTVIRKMRMPRGSHAYLQIDFAVSGGENFNAGAVDAFLTPDPESVGQMLRPASNLG